MKPINEIIHEQYGAVRCPSCGECYTHQIGVHAFWRSEDAPTGVHDYSCRSLPVARSTDQDYNPSARRDGIVIEFSCEFCSEHEVDPAFGLTISQHKGFTLIDTISYARANKPPCAPYEVAPGSGL